MTANDSDVSDGETLTGSQVVRVYGRNLTAPFVTLTFGDVEYTPLAQGEGYIEFILGDNGTATINVDGSRFMSFEVEGVVIPEGLPCLIRGCQTYETASSVQSQSRINNKTINSGVRIDYNYVQNNQYPHFFFVFYLTETSEQDYEYYNCSVNAQQQYNNFVGINVDVIDVSKPAWVTYQGFIIAVFNYTTD